MLINTGAGNDTVTLGAGITRPVYVLGGGGNNTLAAPNAANTWQITGANQGVINNSIYFFDMPNLVGGTVSDDFVFGTGGSVSGNIGGGGGQTTIDVSALAGQNVSLSGLGTVAGFNGSGPGPIAGVFQNVNSIKGSSTDSLTGLNANSAWTIVGAAGSYASGGRTLTFTNFGTLNGGSGNDTFQIGGATGNLTLAGGMGNDIYQFLRGGSASSKYTIIEQPNQGNDTVDFSHLPPADQPAQAADWIDGMGGATSTSLCSEPNVGTVMVGAAGEQENIAYGLNIRPYLDLSGVPSEAVVGEPLIFRYVNVGTAMTHVSSINWGDGTTTNLATAEQPNGNPALVTTDMALQGTATLGHPFATMKTYKVTFTVTNTNSNVSPPASTSNMATATVTIVTALVIPDPQRPGQKALFVGSSLAANSIALAQQPNGTIAVSITSPPYYAVFSPSALGHLYVYATTGSNAVTLGSTITHDAVVYATGPGNDAITDGGSGNDRLYGGGGSNVIHAGSGTDIVYGGPGTNDLYAGKGNDTLVGLGLKNYLYGGLGRDVLIGGPGQSYLYGD